MVYIQVFWNSYKRYMIRLLMTMHHLETI